jgi:hypothetical protein
MDDKATKKQANASRVSREIRSQVLDDLINLRAVTQVPVLKAEEVCSILKVCAEAGVNEITFRDLNVRFGPPAETRRPEQDAESASPSSSETVLSEIAAKIDQETIEEQEIRIREQQLDELRITDPLAYEKLVISGELVDGIKSEDEE